MLTNWHPAVLKAGQVPEPYEEGGKPRFSWTGGSCADLFPRAGLAKPSLMLNSLDPIGALQDSARITQFVPTVAGLSACIYAVPD